MSDAVNGSVAVARTPDTAAAAPEGHKKTDPQWLVATPLDHIPGEPVPGYEQPRESYSFEDRTKMLMQLTERERTNVANVAAFAGGYVEALTEIWGTYLTEAMAQASEESSWSFFEKLVSFAIRQGLIAALTFGAGWFAEEVLEIAVSKIVEWTSEKLLDFGLEYGAEKI